MMNTIQRMKLKKINYPAAVQWTIENCFFLDDPIAVATLTEPASKERFFELLPDLDYEVHGGTWEEPLWAWITHPWFKELKE